MGRITVFTAEGCPHCVRAKTALAERGLPYIEISVSKYPTKRQDMLKLTGNRASTPQIFFNTRHVGGADDTVALMQQWDSELNRPNGRFKTAVERYEYEIGRFPDPVNPFFSIPDDDQDESKASLSRGRSPHDTFVGPDGSNWTVLAMTEKLKNVVPKGDHAYGNVIQKQCFSGEEAVQAFKNQFQMAEDAALALLQYLQDKPRIILHVAGNPQDPMHSYYRLQCFHRPDVLNSYRVWTDLVVDDDHVALVRYLYELMDKMEQDSSDKTGSVDLSQVMRHPLYPTFEEAVCELQGVQLGRMDDKTKIAFGLNVYNLMIKYAFVKVGVAASDGARRQFYDQVKFEIGGHVYSFQDWLSGFLRGNRKAPGAVGPQFAGKGDPRLAYIVQRPDPRIHFGLNSGSRSCPPVSFFSAENLEQELTHVAWSFCEEPDAVLLTAATEGNHKGKPQVSLSPIFAWYTEDFFDNKSELLPTLISFLNGMKKQSLERMLDQHGARKINVIFVDYDWSIAANNYREFPVYDLFVEQPIGSPGRWSWGKGTRGRKTTNTAPVLRNKASFSLKA